MFHDNNNAAQTQEQELAEVLELLSREPLCPRFLTGIYSEPGDTPFVSPARHATRNPEWTRGGNSVPEWIDGDPIHPESPDALAFFGNFYTVSRVFNFHTDDAEVIAKMREAISANITSNAFKAAYLEYTGGAL